MAGTDEYEPYDTIWEFLEAKGSVGLLTLLYERARTFSELESEIEITSSTITRRLADVANLDLLTADVESGEHGTKKVYMLTDKGEFLARQMAAEGITSSYHKMREHQNIIEEKTQKVVNWVEQNQSTFQDFDIPRNEPAPLNRDTESRPGPEEVPSTKEPSTEPNKTPENASKQETDDSGADVSEEASERPRPPGDSLPDDLHESDEDKVQGTLLDMENKREESTEEDSGS